LLFHKTNDSKPTAFQHKLMNAALTQRCPVIRVLATDRTPMDSQLLAEALSKSPAIEICGAYSDSKSALAATEKERPQVVILSSKLEDTEAKGFEVARALKSMQSSIRVIMLLDASEPAKVVEAFRSGATGVFCRSQSLQSLVKCIQSVHLGQVWANSNELTFLLDALNQTPSWNIGAQSLAALSNRERDVVRAVAEGRTNREIGKHLGLTEHTVKNYLFRIFDKLGVSTRVELVVYALACGPSQGMPGATPSKKTGPRPVSFPVRETGALEQFRPR
jgi:DNA-binding NarL/FixJ family response regulator